MKFDPASLEDLRSHHPAWQILRYAQAPLAIAFLHGMFVAQNSRQVTEDDAIEALDDQLYAMRASDPDASGRSAREYLIDWASDERGFIRRFYPLGSEEPHITVTPGVERAIAWLATLGESSFVGTESRLLTAIELLRQLDVGTDTDVATHLADLHYRRAELDLQIARVEAGDLRLLDDRAVAERFQQFVSLARELLADFRQVEENFRSLDRTVRERIAQWDGSKGELLGDIFGERDVITSSDQGASFRAFWDVLSSTSRQDELSARLGRVMSLQPVVALAPDRRIRRIHHDWFNAGDHTQRTVASLTAQLRRFIDDKTWLDNRRIVEILRSIEQQALAVRDMRPPGFFTEIAYTSANINLPMERRLAAPPTDTSIDVADLLNDDEANLDALFSDTGIDLTALADNIDDLLIDHSQVTLADVCERHPLTGGLAELVAYLQLNDDRFDRTLLDDLRDRIHWKVGESRPGHEDGAKGANEVNIRTVDMPRVVFVRG